MRICVISDIHYKYRPQTPEDRQNQELILSFLKSSLGKYDLLVLNGDIFDLWYDWQRLIIKQYFPLLFALKRLQEEGCQIVYLSGNHDFWFGDFFQRYLGVKLYPDHHIIEADGKKLYFCHGDLHTVNDLRYQFFRKLVRLPFIKHIFGLLHPEFALSLGCKLSRSSRKRTDPAALRARKSAGLIKFADNIIKQEIADYVIMGHSHQPLVKELSSGIYANSGDWISSHSYLEIVGGELALRFFSLNKENQS